MCVQSAPPEVPLSLISLLLPPLPPFTHTASNSSHFSRKVTSFVTALSFFLSFLQKPFCISAVSLVLSPTHRLFPFLCFLIRCFVLSPPHSGYLSITFFCSFFSFNIFSSTVALSCLQDLLHNSKAFSITQEPLPSFPSEKGLKVLGLNFYRPHKTPPL